MNSERSTKESNLIQKIKNVGSKTIDLVALTACETSGLALMFHGVLNPKDNYSNLGEIIGGVFLCGAGAVYYGIRRYY